MPDMSLPSWERGLKRGQGSVHDNPGQSLPSWERGLKHNTVKIFRYMWKSLPSWERGLKHMRVNASTQEPRSLPSWERGLKLHEIRRVGDIKAPFVGARIETLTSGQICAISVVAPIMGTWIETRWLLFLYHFCGSLPSWEQGLKSDPL